MNILEVVGNYLESEEIYENQLKNLTEVSAYREPLLTRVDQIRTGEGVFMDGARAMNEDLAGRLNTSPNPERNGLVLHMANSIMEILNREYDKYGMVVRYIYTLPPGTGVNLPKQKPQEFGTAITQTEYTQLRTFISETMISGIKDFKTKHSSQETIEFKNLALNLYKAGEEIRRVI
jgi:hypothetical protein